MVRYEVIVHPGGRITVPAAIRRHHDLHPGDVVTWFEQDGHLSFRKAHPDELAAANDHPSADGAPDLGHADAMEE